MTVVSESHVKLARERAAELRQLADLIEQHPEIDASYTGSATIFCVRSLPAWQAIVAAGIERRADVEYSAFASGGMHYRRVTLSWGHVQASAVAFVGDLLPSPETSDERFQRLYEYGIDAAS